MANSIEFDAGARTPGMDLAAATTPLAVAGVRLAAGASRTRYKNRDDLTVIELASGARVHCLFTRNKFCAAPISVARRHLAAAAPRYLVINAGNANAGTGRAGEEAAREVCAAVAAATGCLTEQVLPFSTGVIGQALDAAGLARAVPAVISRLALDGWPAAAAAIMTTDTRAKLRSRQAHSVAGTCTVTGIAKGSGMIKPDMATMLAYVATDCTVAPPVLARLTERAAAGSFNRITVDGDTSTNDAFVLMASGAQAELAIDSIAHPHYPALEAAVGAVCRDLAHDIVRDGEGATKFISVTVAGGTREEDCLKIAYAVAESPLVKTALFASDANWGRILAAVGRAGVADLDIGSVAIGIGGYPIVAGGEPVATYEEARAAAIMREPDIEIAISIGSGPAATTVWTCDLSYDYVKINGAYRT